MSKGQEGPKKYRPRKIPRNPLIRLDSDERIQGNPRKSNPLFGGFHDQKAASQEIPNGSAGGAEGGAPVPGYSLTAPVRLET